MNFFKTLVLASLTVLLVAQSAVGQDSSARFVDLGNGTIKDTKTKLIWLKNQSKAIRKPGYPGMDWDQATAWAKELHSGQCDLKDASKKGDWRLPTNTELEAFEKALGKVKPEKRTKMFPTQQYVHLRFWTSSERRSGHCAIMNTQSMNNLLHQQYNSQDRPVEHSETAMPKGDADGTVWPVRKANKDGK